MPFSDAAFDTPTLATLRQIFDESWEEVRTLNLPSDAVVVRNLLAARILLAALDGERDPAKLKAAALGKVHANLLRVS